MVNDLEEISITHQDVQDREPLKKRLGRHRSFYGKPKVKTGKVSTEEMREKRCTPQLVENKIM